MLRTSLTAGVLQPELLSCCRKVQEAGDAEIATRHSPHHGPWICFCTPSVFEPTSWYSLCGQCVGQPRLSWVLAESAMRSNASA